MYPQTIGIVSGAGPMAGVSLLNQVLVLCQKEYGCFRDADFPKIILLSYPFSEMLTGNVDEKQIERELESCLVSLRLQGAAVLAIACNTLHAFLKESWDLRDLIFMPKLIQDEMASCSLSPPLVLCTSTSARLQLHKQFFDCSYLNQDGQKELDQVIDLILKGNAEEEALQRLIRIIQGQRSESIVLGCTELSLFTKQLEKVFPIVLDPLEMIAKKIVNQSFSNIKEVQNVSNYSCK